MTNYRCGFIAVIGSPNVGKSTLINRLVGTKVSIMSDKPQTTLHNVLGIKTEAQSQYIYVDTPGIHKAGRSSAHRQLNKLAYGALGDVDVVVWVIDSRRWTEMEDQILTRMQQLTLPRLVVLNKVDLVSNKSALLPRLEMLNAALPGVTVLPLSARRDKDIQRLQNTIQPLLPVTEDYLLPATQTSDQTPQMMAAELLREKLLSGLGDEIPHLLTVQVEHFERQPKLLTIHLLIQVARTSHKAIIIGQGGERLRQIAQQARLAMEAHFQVKVMLKVWVRVRS